MYPSLPFLTQKEIFTPSIAALLFVVTVGCAGGNSAGQDPQAGAETGGSQNSSAGGETSTGGQAAMNPGSGGAGMDGSGGGLSATGGAETGSGGSSSLPATVVGGYWATWPESQIRLIDVPSSYNLIYLFAARPVGGSPGTTGAVEWNPPHDGRGAATNFKADLAQVRQVQGRTVVLSVGGAGQGMSFPNREKSETFVASIVDLYEEFGGFDGLDWNTFEADQAPDTDEIIWISLELKSRFPGFIITAPPAPWNKLDKTFCETMVEAGAMDYAAPQYYDGPGLNEVDYLETNVAEWVALVGAEHLVIGFGIWGETNYWSAADAISGFQSVKAAHPGLKGAFNWAIHIDEGQDWPFANQVAPVVAP